MRPFVLSASSISGKSVVNPRGEDLGEVEEIMLDIDQGAIAYAVVSFGGVLGMGQKLFAVPWGALVLDARENRFVLEVPKERLETAPGFDKHDWPDFADRSLGKDIYDYYAVDPYWDRPGRL